MNQALGRLRLLWCYDPAATWARENQGFPGAVSR
jgi:hypothetical protein